MRGQCLAAGGWLPIASSQYKTLSARVPEESHAASDVVLYRKLAIGFRLTASTAMLREWDGKEG